MTSAALKVRNVTYSSSAPLPSKLKERLPNGQDILVLEPAKWGAYFGSGYHFMLWANVLDERGRRQYQYLGDAPEGFDRRDILSNVCLGLWNAYETKTDSLINLGYALHTATFEGPFLTAVNANEDHDE